MTRTYGRLELSRDQAVKGTIDWCNKIRKSKDLEPIEDLPKGTRADPKSCPCGLATGVEVGCYTYGEGNPLSPSGNLPDAVTAFVLAFDAGDLPEYDELEPEKPEKGEV